MKQLPRLFLLFLLPALSSTALAHEDSPPVVPVSVAAPPESAAADTDSSLPATSALLPRPAALEPAVHFWIRVYTEITTEAGFVHDQQNLPIIYETLHFDAGMSPAARQREVDAEKQRFHDILLRLARGVAPADAEEQRVRDLWGAEATPTRLTEAADDVRFQLGQADRFRAGLIRAGAWQRHIAETLARLGLPPQLAALPDVESSFDPTAYSKVGAAGLWQFLRSTGRRFLRINAAVDERFDPFRETEAAAQLLAYDYRLLGSWPLAITAYNHGAAGMLRAREQLGTDDIVRILHDYHSPTFGFASRNFYVSFLAALTVAQNPDQYFGSLHTSSEIDFHELKMPTATSVAALVRAVDVDRRTLQRLNPALRPAVWNGRRSIPAGYVLRLPAAASDWTEQLLSQRLTGARVVAVAAADSADTGAVIESHTGHRHGDQRTAAATPLQLASVNMMAGRATGGSFPLVDVPDSRLGGPPPDTAGSPPELATPPPQQASEYYFVRPGDTVSSIAQRFGMPLTQLLMLNSLPDEDFLYEGERLRLAASVPEPGVASSPAMAALVQQAVEETQDEQQAVSLARHTTASTEPVSAAQAEGPQLVPGVSGPQSADPVDYSVSTDGSIRVVAAETLGHYAEWLDTTAARLRALNHLRGRTPVLMGRRLQLDFRSVTPQQFEQRRRDYHERLEAGFFASHRIVGTTLYVARRGDSLWNITRRDSKIPVWLLQQYNPNLAFGDLRPGTQVSLPQLEELATP